MSNAKQDKTFVVTPVGIADYPHLNSPDTKYKPEGEYKVTLKVPAGTPADALMARIEKLAEAVFQQALKAAKPNSRVKKADLPAFKDAQGNVILKAKMRASGVTKAGEPFTQAPRIFNAQNQPWDASALIRGGSELRLNTEVVAFNTPTLGAGISLRLKDVQVMKLAVGGNSASPFDAVAPAESEGFAGEIATNDNDADF